MEVSKEEILHIAKLADLKLREEEIPTYIKNLEDILNFANVVNSAPIEGLETTIGENGSENVFRKDEIKEFDNIEGLLQNAPSIEQNMFKIPKVVQ
jgi:aspartyl-tRNA(Asn)/glutamyl-tRNA(Gln) amidotransferase subunit C